MANGYSKQIQLRIHESPEGSIFVNSDFADIADTETIRRNLNRLTKVGILRRIINGIYEKPKYSKLLDEYVAADPAAVAHALARSYHWTIAPCGVAALATASGAAAITYTIEALAQAGDHIVAQKTIYGGSYNLLEHTLTQFGVTTTFVDAHDLKEVENAIQPKVNRCR